jgi:hypothetical protein
MNEGLNLLGKEVTYVNQNNEVKTGVVEALKQTNGKYSAVVGGVAVELEQISLIKK